MIDIARMRVKLGAPFTVEIGALMTFCVAHETGVNCWPEASLAQQVTSGCGVGVAMTGITCSPVIDVVYK